MQQVVQADSKINEGVKGDVLIAARELHEYIFQSMMEGSFECRFIAATACSKCEEFQCTFGCATVTLTQRQQPFPSVLTLWVVLRLTAKEFYEAFKGEECRVLDFPDCGCPF